ncbi:MAG: bile acid:sodium symporter family protein [Planctomycetota bacterium]|jgi:BASS family bile acid:Na+ symporter
MLKKVLAFYTKYFAVWVVACGVIAFFWPELFLMIEEKMAWFFAATIERILPHSLRLQKGMNWFFALTMFGIGAVLQIEDFKRIAKRPVIVLIGSAAQFSIMPLGSFVLAKLFGLPPEIAVGLILTGSAPGAMASNVMSYIAKADTAYSVSLTTVSTLLCPLLTPGLTFLLAGSRLEIPFWDMVLSVIKMVILPLFIGFGVRHYLKEKIEKVLPIFPAISVTFIIFICSMVIALNHNRLGQVTGFVLITAVILNLYGMLCGYSVGSAFRMEVRRRRTLALEIGMQNAGLGTVLALEHFGEQAAIPAAIFVFICIITASVMAEIWQKKPVEAVTSAE